MKNIFILSILLFLYAVVGCSQNSKKSFTSFKQTRSELEKQGYAFSDPYDDQGRMRISSVDQTLGRSVYIYFNKDTVTELKLHVRIKTNRDTISKHFDLFFPFIRVIDPEGESWIRQTLSQHDVKQQLKTKKTINRKYYILNYYPDYENDLLNIGIFNKEPSF